ncbi:MAG: hypothetical protein QMD99_18950 [Rhizobiaceae bacterium]|nr:hypothetical protein [Rhizobiaceae bacterium]
MSITFNNVHKTLRQKRKKTAVFEGANVTFDAGKISGVLAPPGSGKTTAARLVTGKLRPDFGRVQRSSLVSFPVGAGGVFNGLLSGRENLAFLCRIFGFDPRPIIRFVVEYSDLGEAIDKPLKFYNRDERTKLLFTSCYAIPFDTYIVDDTIIGGRGQYRDKCEALLKERMDTAGFVIFSSSPTLLRKYCDAFYVIDNMGIHGVASADDAISVIGEAQLRDGDGYTETASEGGDVYDLNPR